jgi:LmbE family N-acetylglucosaminyl deacetylase
MLLDRANDLALIPGQKARLETLDRQWKVEAAGLEAAVRQEQEVFSRFMVEAQAGGKTSMPEIQRRSADLRELSETLRERRQQHAKAALEVLGESQRQMLSPSAASARHGGA